MTHHLVGKHVFVHMCVCVCEVCVRAYPCVYTAHTRVPSENSCHFHTFIGKLRYSAVICPRNSACDPACVHAQLTNRLTSRGKKRKPLILEKGSLLCIHVFFSSFV